MISWVFPQQSLPAGKDCHPTNDEGEHGCYFADEMYRNDGKAVAERLAMVNQVCVQVNQPCLGCIGDHQQRDVIDRIHGCQAKPPAH